MNKKGEEMENKRDKKRKIFDEQEMKVEHDNIFGDTTTERSAGVDVYN